LLEIMSEIASGIDVRENEIEEKRVEPAPVFADASGAALPPLMRVRCLAEKPSDACAPAKHRWQWFWIDDRDIPSMRVFAFLMLPFSLVATGGKPNLPALTIPAG